MQTSDVRHSDEAFADSNGITLCYDTFGAASDPPLLLIMGLATQMIVWEEDFCAQLAARGRFVIRFDNRDIGRSTRMDAAPVPNVLQAMLGGPERARAQASYTLRDMAADSVGLLDALGIASAHVVGISMGGAIAQEIAIHFPERIRTLTTIMAASGDPKIPPPTWGALGVLLTRGTTVREKYLQRYVKTWRILCGKHFPFDQARTRAQGERAYARGVNPAGAARQMLAIVASGNRKPGLARLTLPALMIHGTEDPLIRYPAASDLAHAIPGAKLLPIQGMGHTLPRQTWPVIIDAIVANTSTPGT